ncbi:MAG: hypothetical protein U0166_19455 [Acidobacteriota bacterium]
MRINLVRKRRKRSTSLVIIIVTVLVIGGGAGIVALRTVGTGALPGFHEPLDIRFVDVEALDGFHVKEVDAPLDYVAIDSQGRVFPRGASVTFTVLPRSASESSLVLTDLAIDLRSFTPLAQLSPSPGYDPPVPGEEATGRRDVLATLSLEGAESAAVQWESPVLGVSGKEAASKPEAARAGSRQKTFRLLPAPGATPLASINATETRRLVASIVLATPGKAVVGLRAFYTKAGKEHAAATKDSVTIVYDPSRDAGSLAFQGKAFETVPSFKNAKVFCDGLVKAGQGPKALDVAQRYRLEEAGPDADWLVGDTYRALGQFQKAYDEGFATVSKQKVETLSEDRHARYDEVRAWLADMIQAKKIVPRE